MFVFTRRSLFFLCAIALAACSSPFQGGATPSVDTSQAVATGSTPDMVLDSAPEVTGGREVVQKLSIHPNAKSPAILINFVANGPAQGGVPCISCVNGASSNDNIGMTGPSSYVYSGSVWQYALSFTDISYKGKCKLAWAITAGRKTVDSFSATLNLSTAGGFILYALNRNRPKFSGLATLTGKVTCGKNTPSLQVPLEFQ
jgi:hypothetical protein